MRRTLLVALVDLPDNVHFLFIANVSAHSGFGPYHYVYLVVGRFPGVIVLNGEPGCLKGPEE